MSVDVTRTQDPEVAARALVAGHLVVLPTETVYGLAGRADRPATVARIYSVKGRPTDHPLIVHVADPQVAIGAGAQAWARSAPRWVRPLLDAEWPGPMTVVLPRAARAGDDVTGGQDTVALRVPGHPIALAVLRAMDELEPDQAPHGVAAPSANRFGSVSPTTVGHVLADLAGWTADDVALDGGACQVGLESTIVDATGLAPRILRPGAVSAGRVAELTGRDVLGIDGSIVRAPGMLPSHYAPSATVEIADPNEVSTLVARAHSPGTVGLIAPVEVPTPAGAVRLAEPGDDAAYARGLYAALRAADVAGLTRVIAVPPSVDTGLRAAVLDRLQRAAAPR